MKRKEYCQLSIKEALRTLKTQSQGLSIKEAALRLEKTGPNKLPEAKRFSGLTLFLHQLKNPLIYILFAALVISFATGHLADGWIILAVILISSVVGFLQEYKAGQALAALKQIVKHKAKVVRGGQEIVIAQEEVVPGDVILLSAGDNVPADARLLETLSFEVIEAALTGESVPSSKSIDVLPQDTPLADRENMVYLGTVVARGRAKAIVTATGQKTELGNIATLVKETKDAKTPLQKQLTRFGRIIGLILILVNILIFGLGILTGKPLFEMFLTSVAVVAAAVPEGLLPAMTVILAIGMQRLARRKGLVRQMLAAETLGSVSVICTDKTGTLTRGEMRVVQIITETTKLSHDGKRFSQALKLDGEASHITALKIGLLCSDAIVENPKEELKDWIIAGTPTEKAVLIAGYAAGLTKERLEEVEPRVAEIPFDSKYKYNATLNRLKASEGKKQAVYAMGAPEKILNFSSEVDIEGKTSALTSARREEIQKEYENLTGSGLRVLAVGYKIKYKDIAQDFTEEQLADLVFVGLIALKDPLRPEAKKAMTLLPQAGIRPIIVTGDHKLTALAIVRELGIRASQNHILEGVDLDELTDEQLREAVKKTVIFARVEPEHKIRIVEALQANGEVVAMTGSMTRRL
jgi:P-type Ca2+ transporter type 2C